MRKKGNKVKILLTVPSLSGKGGVSSYYKAIFPYLKKLTKLEYLEIGSTCGRKLNFIFDQLFFCKKIKNNSIELVHINPSLYPKNFLRDGFFAWQAKKRKKRLLVFFHGWNRNFENKIDNSPVLRKFFWYTFGKADAFIVLASDFKNKLREWGITVPIYLETTAVDDKLLEDFDIQKKLKAFSGGDIINFLFLARLEKEKGIIETIDIFDILKSKYKKIKLIIAGDGPYKKEVLERINKSPYRDEIKYVGYIKSEEKKEVFKKAPIYVFPTYYGEGLPTSVLEAMCFGCFVVTTDVGGLKDLWKRHKWGIQIKTEDVKNRRLLNLINLLQEILIKNKEFIINTMKKNYLFGINNFLASKVSLRLKEIYNKIIEKF